MEKKLIILSILLIRLFSAQAQWSLTGNASTIPPGNFLGTTDNNNLIFKVNSQQAGILGPGNTGFGYQALQSNGGTSNTATGYQALFSNTSGSSNDAFGCKALFNNTTANANSAFGNNALYNNTTGVNNYAFGCYSLYSNTTGTYNVASAGFALFNNSTGSHNTGLGYRALSGNTTANDNTAGGYEALYSNTGFENTGVGYQALFTNTSGAINTAVGYQALYSANGGGWNTACGAGALYSTTTESSNTGVGYMVLYTNSTGYQNTATGRYALYSNTTGADNTALGEKALYTNTTGSFNTAMGALADVNAGNYSNTTVVGYQAIGTASNQVRIGNSSVTSIRGYANWSNISDGRFKKNIKENVPGLEFINQLRPVTYNLDVKGINQYIQGTTEGKIAFSADETDAINQKEAMVLTGFVAQEVETAAKKIGFDFSGIDAPKNDKDLYSLRYDEFVVPLVKSMQELIQTHDSLNSVLDTLESELNDLLQQAEAQSANIRNSKNANSLSDLDDAPVLNQNSPNPFGNSTIITYHIPVTATHAQIIVSDMNGQILKAITVNTKGPGQVSLPAESLPSGTYIYSLIINGTKVVSKKMVLTR